ncbi:hypothetical protein EVC24_036 [Rhizobium phage RHph_I4]|nr:hypothetical protein EVC24_036 [Rhizobium phage RHph_I4]
MTSVLYEGYAPPQSTCGDCRFFVRWQDKEHTWRRGTYCGFVPPRIAGIESWGKQRPECFESFPACSMFSPVQPVALGQRKVKLTDD